MNDYLPRFKQCLPNYHGAQLYLIACVPKSGSTYASEFLSSYLGTSKFFAGKVPNRAIQDLDGLWIQDAVDNGATIIHQHVPYHPTTQAYIDAYNMKPLVLVRNLFDTLVSIRDHLIKIGNGNWPGVYFDKLILDKPIDEIEIAISHLIIPWYFTFYAGWVNTNYPILTYEEVITDPTCILNSLKIRVDYNMVDIALKEVALKDTRKNVAISSRGNNITDEAKRHIL